MTKDEAGTRRSHADGLGQPTLQVVGKVYRLFTELTGDLSRKREMVDIAGHHWT